MFEIIVVLVLSLILLIFVSLTFVYILTKFVRISYLDILFCEILGWHSYGYDNTHKADNDPNKFLTFAKCKWCEYEGQIDSQGNLF